ncbi:MAG: glycoside hydrolase family 13 protein [Actinomycetes bacterium]
MTQAPGTDWWRKAVVYQVYPRSFADANADGTGDVRGIIDRLDYLQALGVDAVWISPWYPSPLADGGYDVSDYRDIHPDFGSLDEADELVAQAHARGLRVLIDLVPNHSSDQHPWFQAALAAGPGSPERERYIFRDGRGAGGDEPPNNWAAMFGGSAWERVVGPDGTPEQWYLHLFAPEQPDWNWEHPQVADEFDAVLRFWFDRGVDGFRIDVGDSMAKDMRLPDVPLDPATGLGTLEKYEGLPFFDQPHVHDILRRWRTVADGYADSDQGPRVFVSEAWLTPAERLARYVRDDELHTTFNFDALACEWSAKSLRSVIDATVAAMTAVGAPCTWVLANHDTTRVVSRYGKPVTGLRFASATEAGEAVPQSDDLFGVEFEHMPVNVALGRRRARAAALLELALPGGAYIYHGDELGLEEVDLPDEVLQDPTWVRSGKTVRGRDGCRVPLPWSGTEPPFGFGSREREPWLPQPAHWAELTAAVQEGDPASTLSLYRAALAERRANPALGDGTFAWDGDAGPDVLSFSRDPGFRCLVNLGAEPVALPSGGEILIASGPVGDGLLPTDTAVWLRV